MGACKVFSLTTIMCLHSPGVSGQALIQQQNFNKWILYMRAGHLPTVLLDGEDEATWIRIPRDRLLNVSDDPIEAERCILSSTNDEVDKINLHVLNKLPGDTHDLLSADAICRGTNNFDEMQSMYPTKFLNTLQFSGIPNHILQLKVGAPILLLRNTNLKKGLCNGTRLVVTQISRRVLEAVIITGTHAGEKTLIGRIDMTPTDTCWPFHMRRRQFPVKVCFAMTINKSQGQTFNHVCAYLEMPVFTQRGQLYVAASRVTSRDGLRFYINNNEKCPNNLTRNVVYKEVFYNLPLMSRD
ncbi:uncharacterized protein LOC143594932 [Bidens hawaiensis]|uniref:uncharacterized protein LOC143594932 n=1 Tax=Bidens hawaiensis TaxID=980011 RepID=UPI00404A7C6B